MKLLAKYNRLNIIATIIIFLIGSCTFYFLLRYILISQVDETLENEQDEISTYVKKYDKLPEIISTKDQHTAYERATAFYPIKHKYDYAHFDESDDLFREIKFGLKVHDNFYLVTVSKPLEETEELLQIIIIVTIAMIALILFTTYIINRNVLNRIWKPFYSTVEKVRKYDLSRQENMTLEKTGIDEFNILNESINSMTERVQKDYLSLKQFTGHAAHEMQTPLAIIRTKLEMLMQNEILLKHDTVQITDIEKAVHKLSRLYQSLLLLTKVENRQFVLNEEVHLDKIIKDKCAEFWEMIEAKGIKMKLFLEPVLLSFHQHLAEIIIGNLLNNAIRYNTQKGTIEIILQPDYLSIANTSTLAELDKEKVFQRFYRHQGAQEEGNGLGLSIVRQICDLAGYTLVYKHVSGEHVFKIIFNK